MLLQNLIYFSEDDILSGQFVWSQLTAAGNVYVRHICYFYLYNYDLQDITVYKLQIAEAYNNLQRLKEEEELLQTEMMQFISTFKEIIPNELCANIQSI